MSSGSYFLILRNDGSVYSNQEFDQILKLNEVWLKNDFSEKDFILDEIQEFQKVNQNLYVSVKSKKKYFLILESWFGSNFSCLTEEFNMNSYNKWGEHEFTIENAKKIIQAIDYILSLKYSRDFELILDNYYLDIFKELYSPFYNRFIKDKNEKITDEEDESGIYSLKKLRTILNTFILLEDENTLNEFEYRLIYKNY